jgi:hypothetical protein
VWDPLGATPHLMTRTAVEQAPPARWGEIAEID